jgi:hypothetical protein
MPHLPLLDRVQPIEVEYIPVVVINITPKTRSKSSPRLFASALRECRSTLDFRPLDHFMLPSCACAGGSAEWHIPDNTST